MGNGSSHSLDRQRGVPVRGDYLRFLRKRRGWTQQEFALLAGYSERLVRKAEEGRCLMPETIQVLAETLTSDELPVAAEDLWLSSRQTMMLFGRLLAGIRPLTMECLTPVASDSMETLCKGAPEVAFTGVFRGRSGLMTWIERFREVLADGHSQPQEWSLLVDQQQAFLHTAWIFEWRQGCSAPLDLDIRVELTSGLIERLTVAADSLEMTGFFTGVRLMR
jgi:transcriptional regulator with XRE-family HTH domain